jgi:hypothetical protein
VLSAWNPNFGISAKRILTVPRSSLTGLALAAKGNTNFLYAANFGGVRIDVWDTSFASVAMPFKDPSIPDGFSPYNIQTIDGLLYVMYAQIGENGLPVSGKGKGFVSVFAPDGSFLRRFASEGSLNVPWGITAAPASFLQSQDVEYDGTEKTFSDAANTSEGGQIDHFILVGNFGDGRISVFTDTGKFIGQLKSGNRVLQIDGLWALSFAPETAAIDAGRLYFTAGPARETDGLFGYLIKQ